MDSDLSAPVLPDYAAMLCTTQLQIGPSSLHEGLLATGWVDAQFDFLERNNLPRRKNQASSVFKVLLTDLFNHTHECWLLRNTHLHVSNPLSHRCFKHRHLLQQIQALYDLAPKMLAKDREIFAFPIEARENHSTSRLQTFFNWAKPIVHQSIKDAELVGQTKPITEYFLPTRPVIPPDLLSVIHIDASRTWSLWLPLVTQILLGCATRTPLTWRGSSLPSG